LIIAVFPSLVAPICYAHLAAAQMGQFMKFEEFADTSSRSGVIHRHQQQSQNCHGFMLMCVVPCSSIEVILVDHCVAGLTLCEGT